MTPPLAPTGTNEPSTEVARLIQGDERAFEALFARLHPRIVALTRRLVGSTHAAEDVAQETWQAVVRGLASFHGHCQLDTWVLQIALNHARTAHARSNRYHPLDPGEEGPDGLERAFTRVGAWANPLPAWPAGAMSPEEAASNRQLIALVDAQLDALPELQRLAVFLCDVEGLPTRSAAEALGVSDVNCRSALHRGRMRIRAALAAAMTPSSSSHWSPPVSEASSAPTERPEASDRRSPRRLGTAGL